MDFEEAYLHVILFQEINDTNVIFERYLVGLWEGFKSWHVASICLDCLEDVLRQADGVELEISLEQQIDDVVDAPFS